MKIGAILPQSLIDFPGKVSTVFFTVGCNFKCPFCYNKDLALGNKKPLNDKEIQKFLQERKDFINAVIISGGEPLLQKDILEFIKKIKKYNLSVGIETNGSHPEILRKLLKEKLVEFVAMDVKSDFDNYAKASGVKINTESILKSINLLKNSNIRYEFRITVVPTLIDRYKLKNIGKLLNNSKKAVLQQFVNDKEMIDNHLKEVNPYTIKELNEFKKLLEKYVSSVELRIS